MHIQTINYTRTFNLGNYSSEKIGVEFALNPGESADKALDNARQLVEEYHKKSVKQIEEAGLYFEQDEPIFEKVIPTQSKKTLTERTKEFINSCTTKQELKAWELMCKNNSELLEYYNNKLNNL
tara:strand:- start:102 stop:473 length:372 start_codon:yes stop_codon:yes gene_type:complete